MGLAKFIFRISGNRTGEVVVDRRHVVSVEESNEVNAAAPVIMRTLVYNYQLYHTLDAVTAALDRATHEPYTEAPPVTRRDRGGAGPSASMLGTITIPAYQDAMGQTVSAEEVRRRSREYNQWLREANMRLSQRANGGDESETSEP